MHLVKLDVPIGTKNVQEMTDTQMENLLKEGNFQKNSVCYKASDAFILRSIGGESVLVPTDGAGLNGMITFSQTGEFLWKLMQELVTEEDLVWSLLHDYAVDEQTARTDVSLFLIRALGCGMIQKFVHSCG